ncbi:hypothetical protein [Microbulbifer sp. SAOS-129_SWC]|uniref:hypothetical protein n=1 Tax=Microbulbifer sp. SAOS-129_SWC TaxID=3145235 RepID=UPI003217DB96
MIERVHLRFQKWAAALEGGPGGGSLLGRLQANGGVFVSGGGGEVVPIDSDVREVEQFVLALPQDLGDTVRLFYLPPYLTHDQAAKKLGISMQTLYRRIDGIHVLFNAEVFRGALPKVS